jgi:hypothetical protein
MASTAKKKKLPTLSFSSNRRFGIELEVNAFDGRNRPEEGKRVAGMDEVAKLVGKYSDTGVEVRGWEHTAGNNAWVVKPDSSCGMEVVSPALRGWRGLLGACKIVEGLQRDDRVKADDRCSVHVHIEVADLNDDQLATVIAYWIKCEPVFLDSMPMQRKRNRYCQSLGLPSRFSLKQPISAKQLIEDVGDVKYYSLNTNQMMIARRKGGKRPTIECRIGEAAGCKDPYLVKNWVRLLIHFVEMTHEMPFPEKYERGKDPIRNGLVWLDPEDVFEVLGFGNNPPRFELSNGLQQTRNWFLSRLLANTAPQTDPTQGLWRTVARRQARDMVERFQADGVEITPERHLHPTENLTQALYAENTKY